MNQNLSIALVCVVAVCAAAACGYCLVSNAGDSAYDISGPWFAVAEHGYDEEGNYVHNVDGLDDLNIDITESEGGVFIAETAGTEVYGTYVRGDIMFVVIDDRGVAQVDGTLISDGRMILTYVRTNTDSTQAIYNVVYNRDASPLGGDPPTVDVNKSWKLYEGNTFNGSVHELEGSDFEITEINGMSFKGTMEQVVGFFVEKLDIKGSFLSVPQGNAPVRATFVDADSNIWSMILFDDRMMANANMFSTAYETEGTVVAVHRTYTLDGSAPEAGSKPIDFAGSVWTMQNSNYAVLGSIYLNEKYDFEIHITAQNNRQIAGYYNEGGYVESIAGTVLGSPTAGNNEFQYKCGSQSEYPDVGKAFLSSDGRTLHVVETYYAYGADGEGSMCSTYMVFTRGAEPETRVLGEWSTAYGTSIEGSGAFQEYSYEEGESPRSFEIVEYRYGMVRGTFAGLGFVGTFADDVLDFEVILAGPEGSERSTVHGTMVSDNTMFVTITDVLKDASGEVGVMCVWNDVMTLGGMPAAVEFGDVTGDYGRVFARTYNGEVHTPSGATLSIDKQVGGAFIGTFQQTVGDAVVDKTIIGSAFKDGAYSYGSVLDETGNIWSVRIGDDVVSMRTFMLSEMEEIAGDLAAVTRVYSQSGDVREPVEQMSLLGEWECDCGYVFSSNGDSSTKLNYGFKVLSQDGNAFAGYFVTSGGNEHPMVGTLRGDMTSAEVSVAVYRNGVICLGTGVVEDGAMDLSIVFWSSDGSSRCQHIVFYLVEDE